MPELPIIPSIVATDAISPPTTSGRTIRFSRGKAGNDGITKLNVLRKRSSSNDMNEERDVSYQVSSVLELDGYDFLPRKKGFLKKRSRNGRYNRRFFIVNYQFFIYTKTRSKIHLDDLESKLFSKKTKLAFLDLRKVESITTKPHSKANKLSSTLIIQMKGCENKSSKANIVKSSSRNGKSKTKLDSNDENTLMLRAYNSSQAHQWLEVLTRRWTFFLSNPTENPISFLIPRLERFDSATARTIDEMIDQCETNSSSSSDDENQEPNINDGYFTGEDENELECPTSVELKSAKDVAAAENISNENFEQWFSALKPDYNLSITLFKECFYSLAKKAWDGPDNDHFIVRRKDYMQTGKKMVPDPSLFRVVTCDILTVDERKDNIMEHPKLRYKTFQEKYKNMVAEVKREDCTEIRKLCLPFIFTMHIQVPGPPFYSVLTYFTPKDHAFMDSLLNDNSTQLYTTLDSKNSTPKVLSPATRKLWRDFFVGAEDELRDERYKLIPKIMNAPFVVKAATPTKPALLGKKLKQRYFREPVKSKNGYDWRYLELCSDVGSSVVAWKVCQLCSSYAKMITVDMAVVIEGRSEEELQEEMVGVVRIVSADLKASPVLTEIEA